MNEAFKCADNHTLDIISDRSAIFLNRLDVVAQNSSVDDLLPILCCAFEIFQESLKQANGTKCGSTDLVAYIADKVKKTVSDPLDLICSDRKVSGSQCIQNLSAKNREIFLRFENVKDLTDKSLAGAMLNILGRLSE